MKLPLALALFLCAATGSALANVAPVTGPDEANEMEYANERFGFRVAYPSLIFTRVSELEGGAGLLARSQNGSAELRAYAAPAPASLGALYQQDLAAAHRLAYHGLDLSAGTYVVAGEAKGRGSYRKVFVRGGVMKVLELRYPAGNRALFEALARRIGRSF